MTMKSESGDSVEQRIAVRAYEMWMRRGAPISDGKDDWFAARMEIQAELMMAGASPAKRKAKVAKSQASTTSRTKVKSEGRRAQA